ncbi:MAG: DUF739 family protein [Clostridia bacterium]|jgi:cyanate lyase
MKSKKKRRYPILSALKGRIREKGTSYMKLANTIGSTSNAISNKINGYYSFNSDEMNNICNELEIENSEISKYFFPNRLLKES